MVGVAGRWSELTTADLWGHNPQISCSAHAKQALVLALAGCTYLYLPLSCVLYVMPYYLASDNDDH